MDWMAWWWADKCLNDCRSVSAKLISWRSEWVRIVINGSELIKINRWPDDQGDTLGQAGWSVIKETTSTNCTAALSWLTISVICAEIQSAPANWVELDDTGGATAVPRCWPSCISIIVKFVASISGGSGGPCFRSHDQIHKERYLIYYPTVNRWKRTREMESSDCWVIIILFGGQVSGQSLIYIWIPRTVITPPCRMAKRSNWEVSEGLE